MTRSVPWRQLRRRMTLRQRVRLVVIVLVSLLVAIAVVAMVTGSRVDRANRDISGQLLPALAAVADLEDAYRDQASAQREYVLTVEQAARQAYDEAPAAIVAATTDLSTLLAGHPAVLAALATVERAYQQWLQQASRPAVSLAAQGRSAEALAIIAPGGVSGQLYTDIRDGIVRLRSSLQELVIGATARVGAAQHAVTWTVGVALAAGLAIAALTLLGLRLLVTRPLTNLVASVSAVAGGAVDKPVSVRGAAEITEIGAAVERMRQQLERHTRQAVAAQHRATKSSESERIAADLREHVIERLFATGVALTSLAGREPQLSTALLSTVHDLDQVSDRLRRVIFDLNLAGGQPQGLRRQIIDMVGEVERDLGFTPTVDINGPLDTAVDAGLAEELVTTARKALSAMSLGNYPGHTAILLSATDGAVRLLAQHDGSRRTPTHRQASDDEQRWTEIIARATDLGGSCSVRHDDRSGTVLDWSVPMVLAGSVTGPAARTRDSGRSSRGTSGSGTTG